jgi:hypothetical protein
VFYAYFIYVLTNKSIEVFQFKNFYISDTTLMRSKNENIQLKKDNYMFAIIFTDNEFLNTFRDSVKVWV